ncbi:MAG: hypothetical protein QW625_01615 [Candidatus Nanoarchaeia archaeon]
MPEWTLEQLTVGVLVIIAFIILIIVLIPMKASSSFWYSGCEGKIAGDYNSSLRGYENPLCTSLVDNNSCIYTWGNITKGELSLQVCLWSENYKKCVMNPSLICDDFAASKIECSKVPDCRPIIGIKRAVQNLIPGGRQ